jgi:branched-chain amino acid transport system substrate-binding protein
MAAILYWPFFSLCCVHFADIITQYLLYRPPSRSNLLTFFMRRYLTLTALGLLTIACGVALTGQAQTNVIRIGIALPLSGDLAGSAASIKAGTELAVAEAKASFAKLGFSLDTLALDDKADRDTGKSVAAKLVADKNLLAVVGHYNSGVTIAASDVYEAAGLAFVAAAATNPKLTDRGLKSANRVCGRDDVQGPAGADYAFTALNLRRVFIVFEKNDYGQGIAEAFRDRYRSLGGTIGGYIGVEVDKDSRIAGTTSEKLAGQIQLFQPTLVYFAGLHPVGAPLLKALRTIGSKAAFMGPDGLDTPDFIKDAGADAAGVYYTTVGGNLENYPGSKSFAAAYQKRYTKSADYLSIFGYESAQAVLRGLESAIKQNKNKRPSRSQVGQAIRGLSYDGITGKVEFDNKGDRLLANYFVVQYKEAKYPGTVVKSLKVRAPQR